MTWSYYITPEQYAIAAKNGINKTHVNDRVRKSGWQIEEAITKPVNRQKDNAEWIKVAEANGISRSTFYVRVRKGMSKKEAATKPPIRHTPFDNREYALYKGEELQTIGTLEELTEATGIKRNTLQHMKSTFYQENRNKTGRGMSLVCLDEDEDDAI